MVPALVLPLYTWRQIETKICGNAEIDVEALKRITDCDFGYFHPMHNMFWNVVKSFSNEDRAGLLGFASGQRRLPAGVFVRHEHVHAKINIIIVIHHCGFGPLEVAGNIMCQQHQV